MLNTAQHDFRTTELDPHLLSTPFRVQTNWHVITGAPSSGKSTLIDQLADQGFQTVPEIARQYFERERAKGRTINEVHADPAALQRGMREMQLAFERRLRDILHHPPWHPPTEPVHGTSKPSSWRSARIMSRQEQLSSTCRHLPKGTFSAADLASAMPPLYPRFLARHSGGVRGSRTSHAAVPGARRRGASNQRPGQWHSRIAGLAWAGPCSLRGFLDSLV
jgi:hypothetical protein